MTPLANEKTFCSKRRLALKERRRLRETAAKVKAAALT